MSLTRRILPLVAAVTLGACGRVGSEDVATSEMTATIRVTSDPSAVTTTASVLLEAEGEPVLLVASELLTATNELGEQVVIGPEITGDPTWYGVFDYAADGETITVALDRKVDKGAPLTEVVVPTTFSLTVPEGEVSRANDLVISWQPATTEPLVLTFEAACLEQPVVIDALDPSQGQEVIPAGELVANGACEIDLTVSRFADALLDPGFGAGTAVGEVVRTAVLATVE
jgi:hypothetical protein